MSGPYAILLHRQLPDDLASIPKNVGSRIPKAIEQRLSAAPDKYGERLRRSLRGYWKLRVGDYRVVYDILGREARVYGVMDRREVHDQIVRRLGCSEGRS